MIPKYNIKRIKKRLDSRPIPFLPPVIIQQQMELDIYDPVVLAAFEDMANVYGWVLGDDIEDLYEIDFYFDVTRGVESLELREKNYIETVLRIYRLSPPIFPDDPFFPSYDPQTLEQPIDFSRVSRFDFPGDGTSVLYVDATESYFVQFEEDGLRAYRVNSFIPQFDRYDTESESIPYKEIVDTYRKIYYQDAAGQWYEAILDSDKNIFDEEGYVVSYVMGWVSSSRPKNPMLLKDFQVAGPFPVFYSYAVSPQFIKSNTGRIYQVERYKDDDGAEDEGIKSATVVAGFTEGPVRQAFDSWSSSVLKGEFFGLPVGRGESWAVLTNLTPNFITTAGGYERAGEFGMKKLVVPKSKLFTERLERVVSHFGGEDEAREYLSDNFEVLRALFREAPIQIVNRSYQGPDYMNRLVFQTRDDEMYNLLKPATKRVLERLAQAESQDTQLSFDFF